MKLYHVSNYDIENFSIMERHGIYFFRNFADKIPPFRKNESVVHVDTLCERFEKKYNEEIPFGYLFYGSLCYKINFYGSIIRAEKVIKLSSLSKRKKRKALYVLREQKFYSDDDGDNSSLECFINKTARNMGYDAVLYRDETEGAKHDSIAVVREETIEF